MEYSKQIHVVPPKAYRPSLEENLVQLGSIYSGRNSQMLEFFANFSSYSITPLMS